MKPITVIGGGLAGLALGIGLRKENVPVTVLEAGSYPRHRVCGEFISGAGQESLDRLGLGECLWAAGARLARSVMFFSGSMESPAFPLPRPAISLSRYRLDAVLAREFELLGGELLQNSRWRGEHCRAGTVRASGRIVNPTAGRWRWIGLKVHARAIRLSADLELHFFRNGYTGLSRLPGDEVNICGLVRSRTALTDARHRWSEHLCGTNGPHLLARLAEAKVDTDSFCSVAGMSFAALPNGPTSECRIGDSLSMIPPLTGNGMSIAFESAELAVKPLAEFSRGRRDWCSVRAEIERACEQRFRRRLRWAGWLQDVLFQPGLRLMLGGLVIRCPKLFATLFMRTR